MQPGEIVITRTASRALANIIAQIFDIPVDQITEVEPM